MNIGRKLERVIGAVERALDVAQHRIKPAHVARFGGGTAAGALDDRVRVARSDDRAERPQSVTVDLGIRMQMLLHP